MVTVSMGRCGDLLSKFIQTKTYLNLNCAITKSSLPTLFALLIPIQVTLDWPFLIMFKQYERDKKENLKQLQRLCVY